LQAHTHSSSAWLGGICASAGCMRTLCPLSRGCRVLGANMPMGLIALKAARVAVHGKQHMGVDVRVHQQPERPQGKGQRTGLGFFWGFLACTAATAAMLADCRNASTSCRHCLAALQPGILQ
jgi:hypothetical protein